MNNFFRFLKGIRFSNLLMIGFVQWMVAHYYLKSYSSLLLIQLILATILIALFGYLMNDISDIEIDSINKKQKLVTLTTKNKWTLIAYFVLLFGLILGFFVSYQTAFNFFTYFVGSALVLFLYARFLSRYKLIGNFIIAGLVALSVYISFDIGSASDSFTRKYYLQDHLSVIAYTGFAFLLTWSREIVKDWEDQLGDQSAKRIILSHVVGKTFSKLMILVILLFVVVLFLLAIITNHNFSWLQYIYVFSFIALNIYLIIALFKSKTEEDYGKLSSLFKLNMLIGMIAPLFKLLI